MPAKSEGTGPPCPPLAVLLYVALSTSFVSFHWLKTAMPTLTRSYGRQAVRMICVLLFDFSAEFLLGDSIGIFVPEMTENNWLIT